MGTLDKLKKNSRIKRTSQLDEATFDIAAPAPTISPNINIALQGDLNGGLEPGIMTLAGPSRHFKTTLALFLAKAWMDMYTDCALLYYNSEGKPQTKSILSMGIPMDRVIHSPIKNVEELKFDLIGQLDSLDSSDKVIVLIDSIGNLASKKEADNALSENSAADMTRAKELKSLWRIATPYFSEHNIPCININHTYDSMTMYGGQQISGGQGGILASDDIWVIGRQQDKDGKEVVGYNFIINVEKSRTVRERTKIPFHVTFDEGINIYSGLLDIAIECGYAISPKQGWYAFVDQETGEILEPNFRRAKTLDKEFWEDALNDPFFNLAVRQRYRLDSNTLFKAMAEVEDDC